jgi:SH3-like domain-containing protein
MRATVRNWVIVRAAASRSSRVVASIGPDTRVQLGEARGDWMRIRMKGITGWVERSRF